MLHDKNGVVTRVDLAAFDGYAPGRPYLDAMHFVIYGSQADVATAFKRHLIESAYGIQAPGALTAP